VALLQRDHPAVGADRSRRRRRAEQTLAFAWRELFNPLGMRNVTLQFDASGTLQGSANMLASAR